MLFNSIDFLIYFIIVVLVYFSIPRRFSWVWLLLVSYYFYMYWNAKYLFLILFSTLITYISGIYIEKNTERPHIKKYTVFLSIILNLLILFYFKYFNFFIENVNNIFSVFDIQRKIQYINILLPVGISFYTFQALSYTIDVYRGTIKAEHHLGKYALYLVFFPQLVAGPIEKSSDLLPQFKYGNEFKFENLKKGSLLMLIGFIKKIVIADRLSVLVDTVFSNPFNYQGLSIVLAVLFFTFQIYCDFSGYSDIAIGCAKILGYKLTMNFNKPYLSNTISNFWRRWHISLGVWFRDYLYIPLGGKTNNKLKTYRNLLIVFLISGLWHGASWNFIIWGGIHGVYLVIEKMINNKKNDKVIYQIFQSFKIFIMVSIAWIFFRANNFKEAIYILKKFIYFPFYINHLNFHNIYNLGLDRKDLILSIVLIILLILSEILKIKEKMLILIVKYNFVLISLTYYMLIFIFLIFGYYGEEVQNSFIYFQF